MKVDTSMNQQTQFAPAALFEVAWEVCNKVGGIYTVVSSKAKQAAERFGQNYFLLGPDRGNNAEFIECGPNDEDNRLWETFRRAAAVRELKCRFGRWDIPGRPKVILVDFKGRYNQNQLLYDYWRDFGVDSLTGKWDYIEPVMFATACGEAIAAFSQVLATEAEGEVRSVAHFHEWMCGAGLLYLKRKAPNIATVFTTHATMLGRSMAGSGRDIYSEMDQLDPTKEATNFNVTAKCSMETVSAREADCFTTVSELTAHEAAAFLRRRPDLITPNGLSLDVIPDYSADRSAPLANRKKLLAAYSKLLRRSLPENTRILLISGRYEFRNKGIDLFLSALSQLNKSRAKELPPILAVCTVMGGHSGVNQDAISGDPAKMPKTHSGSWFTSHQIYDIVHDPIRTTSLQYGLDNRPENAVQVVFNPALLDGHDGFLNMTYAEVLSACDVGVFPSWYEPWGYTPQEAAAFAVPTVTSDLAGFGQWLKTCGAEDLSGTKIVDRDHTTFEDSATQLCNLLKELISLPEEELQKRRHAARTVAQLSDWKIFYKNYENAYEFAAKNAHKRVSTRPVSSIDDTNLKQIFTGTSSSTPLLHTFTSTARLPEKLSRLNELARNMWWTWHPESWPLFQFVNPSLWERNNHNAVEIVEKTDHTRFIELAKDPEYVLLYNKVCADFDADMNAPYEASVAELTPTHPIAYFSTEYGIHESLPIYSGGLGVLSGDHLKSASDLHLPLVAVGLLYKCGYFQQKIAADGHQTALYPENNFNLLPVKRVKDKKTGAHLYVSLDMPGRTLYARVWLVQVGRIPLYLLDTDTPKNTKEDRSITEKLYVADRDTRIRQEILLGMGGPKALAALGYHPCAYHMNEGHSAFMILERIRHMYLTRGLSFEAARELVRGDSIFTTHTPVDAGNERFSLELIHRYFDSWYKSMKLTWNDLAKLGCRKANSDFEMTLLALNHAVRSNGVSRLHGDVSRAMWQFNWKGVPIEEIPIGHVTNGVHLASFTGIPMSMLIKATVGPNWKLLPPTAPEWHKIEELPDGLVWKAKQEQKRALLDMLKKLNPSVYQKASASWRQEPLIIGFARRFAPYKRADLLLADMKRLTHLLNQPDRPVIFVYSGKAHPADSQGNDIIQKIVKASRSEELKGKIFFIPNYNLDIARVMVQGCDIWMNTPRRPYEASGTSGQKAAPNGTLNFSVSDGWWCEGDNGKNGWTIGPRVTSIHDTPSEQSDYADAESLYATLENEIIPMFFYRGNDGLPHDWIARMKNSIATLAPQYNSARMVWQYFTESYAPAAKRHVKMRANNRLLPRMLSEWKANVSKRFPSLHIDQVELQGLKQNAIQCTDPITITAWVVPGTMKKEELQLQFVAGRSENRDFIEAPDVTVLTYDGTDETGRLIYKGVYTPGHNGRYLYGVRALPYMEGLENLFEPRLIQWA